MPGLYEIRDPLYDFILFNDLERAVIDSRPFQRLKRIKQLATTHYVYPGAMHTRFEHALGTMHLASVAFDTLLGKGGSRFLADMGWENETQAARARQILRLGALLHDVGHSAFSHAPEELFSGGEQHEHFTKRLIEHEEISSLLKASDLFSIPVEDVVYVAVGPRVQAVPTDVGIRFLGELVFGDLGVDRIDYLNRDSLHIGVRYGRFDHARLINTLTYTRRLPSDNEHEANDPVLALEGGGVNSAEGLFLARYFMFLQVYFHHVRVAYDLHLTDFMHSYLEQRGFAGAFPTDIDSYLALSDVEFEAAIHDAEGDLGAIGKPLRDREHFRLARELFPDDFARTPEILETLPPALAEEFGADVRVHTPSKATYSLKEGDLPVVDGERSVDILSRSDLIRSLPPSIIRMRVYARKERQEEVAKFTEEKMKGVT